MRLRYLEGDGSQKGYFAIHRLFTLFKLHRQGARIFLELNVLRSYPNLEKEKEKSTSSVYVLYSHVVRNVPGSVMHADAQSCCFGPSCSNVGYSADSY